MAQVSAGPFRTAYEMRSQARVFAVAWLCATDRSSNNLDFSVHATVLTFALGVLTD